MEIKKKSTAIGTIFLMVLSHASVYGLIGLKQSFYNLLMDAMGVNDVQIGILFSVYGTVGMLSYIFGGYVSDLFDERKLLLVMLGVSMAIHLYAMTTPGFPHLILIFVVSGITSIFGFYPASNKILYRLAGDKTGGMVFGLYYTFVTVGIGVTTVLGMLLMKGLNNRDVYRALLLFYIVLHVIAILGIIVLGVGGQTERRQKTNKMILKDIPKILQDKRIWIVALIILSNYSLVACMTYINPFFKIYFGMSEGTILKFNILRTYILATVLSPVFGWCADKVGSVVKVMGIGFVCSFICLLYIIVNYEKSLPLVLTVIVFSIFTIVVSGGKNIAVAIITELQIPASSQGTALGIISFIGFSPDAFFYLLAGYMIRNGMVQEYRALFGMGLFFTVLGVVCVGLYFRLRKGRNEI